MDYFRISQEMTLRREESARRQKQAELRALIHEAEQAETGEHPPAEPGKLTRLIASVSERVTALLHSPVPEEPLSPSGAFSQEQLG